MTKEKKSNEYSFHINWLCEKDINFYIHWRTMLEDGFNPLLVFEKLVLHVFGDVLTDYGKQMYWQEFCKVNQKHIDKWNAELPERYRLSLETIHKFYKERSQNGKNKSNNRT